MEGFDMFCERCGTRYASEEAARMAAPLARRLLEAVGVVETAPKHAGNDPFLRFCLACRGYSCPKCWNEAAGSCQTCVPLPEPIVAQLAAAELTIEIEQPPVLALAEAEEPQAVEAVAAEVEAVAAEPEVDPLSAELELVSAESATRNRAGRRRTRGRSRIGRRTGELELVDEAAKVERVAAESTAEFHLVAADAAVEVQPLVAEAEPPLPEFTLDEATFVEPEPDVQWDWTFEPALDFEPEPAVAAAVEPAQPAEPSAIPTPVEPASLPPAPVFRPLEPMGPILPPPPPPAPAQIPRMEFDFPSAPPAFLIAQQLQVITARPALPVGLFDGTGPSIRPCSSCELPVSARARFCRRCGSAQG